MVRKVVGKTKSDGGIKLNQLKVVSRLDRDSAVSQRWDRFSSAENQIQSNRLDKWED